MEMTMTGVILSIVLSGAVALFIAYRFFQEKKGWGLLIMIALPLVSLGAYIYFTAPMFNPSMLAMEDINAQKVEASPAATLEEIAKMEKDVKESRDDVNAIIALSGAYMSRENYDAAISLLETKLLLIPGNVLTTQLTKAYFAKGLFLAEQENYEPALAALLKAKEVSPLEAPFLPDLDHFIGVVEKEIASEAEE